MKKDLEGKYFGQFLVSMQEKMPKNKYIVISLNGMKIVKNGDNQSQKIGYPQIFIRWFRL